MNGAIAELCARTSSTPMSTSRMIMGNIHQRLRLTKNPSSWPAVETRRVAVLTKLILPPRSVSEIIDQNSGQKPELCTSVLRLVILGGDLRRLRYAFLLADHDEQSAIDAAAHKHIDFRHETGEPAAFIVRLKEVLILVEWTGINLRHAEQEFETVRFEPLNYFRVRVLALVRVFVLIHEPGPLTGLVVVLVANVIIQEAQLVR